MWEGAPTVGGRPFAATRVRLQGWRRERRIVTVRTLKPVPPTPQDLGWDTPADEVAVSVTPLERGDAPLAQVALRYAQRADAENVFDEWKNPWGFRGYCGGKAGVTELAARRGLLTYNLWSLFTRLMGSIRALTPTPSNRGEIFGSWRRKGSKAAGNARSNGRSKPSGGRC